MENCEWVKSIFSQFINHVETNIELIDINSLEPLLEDEGRVRIYPTFSFDSTRRFEIYSVEFQTNGYLSTEPHLQGTQEFLTVFSGEVTVTVGEKSFVVNAGKAIRFKADEPHSYENTGGKLFASYGYFLSGLDFIHIMFANRPAMQESIHLRFFAFYTAAKTRKIMIILSPT